MQADSPASLSKWLEKFRLSEPLSRRVAEVISVLPEDVRSDLIEDPHFNICEYEPGAQMLVPLGFPLVGKPARAVLFKRTLVDRGRAFVGWVIAHELAHAHLRNGGRWRGDDPEKAADALAASWGFPKPKIGR